MYKENDWVLYKHHEGWSSEGKILEIRPDGKYVIGEHDKDPEPNTVEKSDIIRKIE